MKSYNDLWRKFTRHRLTHKRPGRLCLKCEQLLKDLEEAARAEDGDA